MRCRFDDSRRSVGNRVARGPSVRTAARRNREPRDQERLPALVVAPRWHHVFRRLCLKSLSARRVRFPRPPDVTVSPYGTSWHYRTEPRNPNSQAISIPYEIPENSLRSWGSCVRIAPGSPFDFAHLADLRMRALRIKSPNHAAHESIGLIGRCCSYNAFSATVSGTVESFRADDNYVQA